MHKVKIMILQIFTLEKRKNFIEMTASYRNIAYIATFFEQEPYEQEP